MFTRSPWLPGAVSPHPRWSGKELQLQTVKERGDAPLKWRLRAARDLLTRHTFKGRYLSPDSREVRRIPKVGTEQPSWHTWPGLTRANAVNLPTNQGGTHCLQDQPQEGARLKDPEKPLTWHVGCLQPRLAWPTSAAPSLAHWPPRGSLNPSETHHAFTSDYLHLRLEVALSFFASI